MNFGTGGSVGGNVTAATLDYSSYASAVTYDIANGANATTGIGGTHTGVTTLTGNGANAATNTVQGGATYTLDNATANKGGDGTVSWTGFGALNAGTSVVFGTGGSVAGSVTAPTLDFSSYVGAISATVTGANAGTVSHVGGSFSGVSTLSASGPGNTMGGSGKTYVLDNATQDAGSSNGVSWTHFGNINDATGTVNFGTGGA